VVEESDDPRKEEAMAIDNTEIRRFPFPLNADGLDSFNDDRARRLAHHCGVD
jgi:hypothetical protein